MSIEERRNEVIEYHFSGGKGTMVWPMITADSGRIRLNLCTLETVAQVDEFIEMLRRAAKAANLPDGPGEAKSA